MALIYVISKNLADIDFRKLHDSISASNKKPKYSKNKAGPFQRTKFSFALFLKML